MSYAFISHRNIDKPRLREFVKRAVALNIPVWLDRPEALNETLPPGIPPIDIDRLKGSIKKGENWPEAIDKALLEAFAIVLFWSNAWSQQRAWLAREHGVALAFHRQKRARYFPVFLDKPDQLSEELTRYRADSVDTVAGYNVAADGESAWRALLKDLEDALRANWIHPLREKDRSDERNVELLQRLPEGPGVNFLDIGFMIIRRFARGATGLVAQGTVAKANKLVLRALGREVLNGDAFTISPTALPPLSPLDDYWAGVFNEGCPLGPRMIAALFLAAPQAVTAGAEEEFSIVLTTIQRR